MADVKISELPDAGLLTTNDVVEIVRGGQSLQAKIPVSSQFSIWRFSTSIANTDPGAGFVKFNSVNQDATTEIYISEISDPGINVGPVLDAVTINDFIVLRETEDTNDFKSFTVTGLPTDNTGWWTIPVSLLQSGANLSGGNEIQVTNVFTGSALLAQSLAQQIQPVTDNFPNPALANKNVIVDPQGNGLDARDTNPFYGENRIIVKDDSESITSSITAINKIELITPDLPLSDYEIHWSCELANTSNNDETLARVTINAIERASDSHDGRAVDRYTSHSGVLDLINVSGVQTIRLDYEVGGSGGNAKIRRARLELRRVKTN